MLRWHTCVCGGWGPKYPLDSSQATSANSGMYHRPGSDLGSDTHYFFRALGKLILSSKAYKPSSRDRGLKPASPFLKLQLVTVTRQVDSFQVSQMVLLKTFK